MSRPKDAPARLICGMRPATAQRYIVVREQFDIIIKQIHKAGCWLSEFENVRPTGLCRTLTIIGRGLIHNAAQIHDYLENEFVSLEKLTAAIESRPDE